MDDFKKIIDDIFNIENIDEIKFKTIEINPNKTIIKKDRSVRYQYFNLVFIVISFILPSIKPTNTNIV